MRWAGHAARTVERKGEGYTGFRWENLQEKKHLRPKRRWKDNITMDLQEVECGGMDWIEVTQDRDGHL
jgi:hypothetical protein